VQYTLYQWHNDKILLKILAIWQSSTQDICSICWSCNSGDCSIILVSTQWVTAAATTRLVACLSSGSNTGHCWCGTVDGLEATKLCVLKSLPYNSSLLLLLLCTRWAALLCRTGLLGRRQRPMNDYRQPHNLVTTHRPFIVVFSQCKLQCKINSHRYH